MKPTIAVHKFTSCDGCQLAFLNMGEDLLRLSTLVDIVHFVEAGLYNPTAPVDLAFIEGSITTAADQARIKNIRASSRKLITIGACATSGGIQALRNSVDNDDWISAIYPNREFIECLPTSKPIKDFVKVDHEIWGCPVTSYSIVNMVHSLLHRASPPRSPGEKLCQECKREGISCVMVTHGSACMGPITRAGCGALCPAQGRACYGCFGPEALLNVQALQKQWIVQGTPQEVSEQKMRFIYSNEELLNEPQ